jgi:hypothetical protein
MSGGVACRCEPKTRAGWYVANYRCNYSTFNGNRRTPSDYSAVRCQTCGASWRTKAAYVESLPLGGPVAAT